MKGRFNRLCSSISRCGFGKTWCVFWTADVAFSFSGAVGAHIWANMFLVLAYLAQTFANRACHNPLQDYFNAVNQRRAKRMAREHIGMQLFMRSNVFTREDADDAACVALSVMEIAGVRVQYA